MRHDGTGVPSFRSVSSVAIAKAAAGRFAHESNLARIDAVGEQPLVRRTCVVDGGGKRVLGSKPIVDREGLRTGSSSEIADQWH